MTSHVNVKDNLVCICCTSQSGNLLKLNSCEHTGFLSYFLKSEIDLKDTFICNICHNTLKKIEVFKQQVEDSTALLQIQVPALKINKLHNLQCSPVETDSISTADLTVEVKSEPQSAEHMEEQAIALEVKVEWEGSDKEVESVEEISEKKEKKSRTDLKMTFKIVEIIENCTFKLWIVPESWEDDGTLNIPKQNIEILRRDVTSTPDYSWQETYCTLKKSGFKDFESAETEVKKMEEDEIRAIQEENVAFLNKLESEEYYNEYDTFSEIPEDVAEVKKIDKEENNVTFNTNSALPKNLPEGKKTDIGENKVSEVTNKSDVENYNYLAKITPTDPSAKPVTQNDIKALNFKIDGQIAALNSKMDRQIAALNTKINGQVLALNTKIDRVSDPQIARYTNQETIVHALSRITLQVDELIKRSENSRRKSGKYFQPIASKSDLYELEKSLKNKDYKARLMKTLSVNCSSGKGVTVSNANKVMEAMFEKKFFETCSWNGELRGRDPKVWLCSYTRVVEFICDLIRLNDRMFTTTECQSLIINICRNARRGLK